ncbi:MAG: hypothetical protein IK084_04725, partial [Bacteroidaceae bacterium]|nr:hypothetical protein [Bacteroidaceae bacterium]
MESIAIPLSLWKIHSNSPSFDSIYVPQYNQLDLREIGIDTSTVVNLSCILESKQTTQLYLEV